jgi:hypothetical protein
MRNIPFDPDAWEDFLYWMAERRLSTKREAVPPTVKLIWQSAKAATYLLSRPFAIGAAI